MPKDIFSVHIMRNLLPAGSQGSFALGLCLLLPHALLKQLQPHHVPPQHQLSLPASPQDLSKLFALSQLLFMGSDTKDKCSYGILYLGKCHASYIQLSTTMPSALCYLQKADFRGK